MKQIVKLFQPRFAALVKAGTKTQTIRKVPKRERDMPKVGNELVAAEWTGAPYRSKQRVLGHGIITRVAKIKITTNGFEHWEEEGHGIRRNGATLDAFAQADGFKNFDDMKDWFKQTHGLPFTGILIQWNNFS